MNNGDVWGAGSGDIANKTTGYIIHLESGQFVVNYTAAGNSNLDGITQLSATELWAVGGYLDSTTSTTIPLSLHSTNGGKTWIQVTVPNRDNSDGFSSITSTGNVLWSAGASSHGGNNQKTLIEEYSSAPDPSPTATASQPANSTNPPTGTQKDAGKPQKEVLGANTSLPQVQFAKSDHQQEQQIAKKISDVINLGGNSGKPLRHASDQLDSSLVRQAQNCHICLSTI